MKKYEHLPTDTDDRNLNGKHAIYVQEGPAVVWPMCGHVSTSSKLSLGSEPGLALTTEY